MSTYKTACVLLAALTFTSSYALAQSNESLSGYTPPPMFGAPTSTPKAATDTTATTPAASVPAPTPAPAVTPAKEFYKITAPPSDKEQVVHDQPLPIEPLTPRQPQKITTVPNKDTIPAYVPPAPKKIVAKLPSEDTAIPTVPTPETKGKISLPVPESKEPEAKVVLPAAHLEAAPAVKNIAPNIKAEDLLSHPVTSQSDLPEAPPINDNPLAVPAAPVEQGLPLPGSVAPQPKLTATKTKLPVKATENKTAPAKKEAAKKDTVKDAKKPEPKKSEVKKPEPKKVEPKKEAVPAEPTKVIKPPQKNISDKAPEKKIPEKKPEAAVTPPVKAQAKQPEDAYTAAKEHAEEDNKENSPGYHLEGKKNMPAVKPTKVDSVVLDKMPLPKIDDVAPTPASQSPNEQVIDKSLQDHLVKPDVKTIEDTTAPKANVKTGTITATPQAETPAPKPEAKPETKAESKPQLISMEYKQDAADIQPDQKKIIDADILPKMEKDKAARLQILAYASATKDGQSSARRVSLSRGLALRAYLLEKDLDPARIDIRALGDNTQEKPTDRVDLLVIPSK